MQAQIEQVFERWRATMGHPRAKLDPKRAKAIRGMLVVGYTVDDLELAIFGCSVSPFHQGQNDRASKFDDIGLICRDAEHVDKFIALAEEVMARRTAKMSQAPQEKLLQRPASAVPDALQGWVKK